MKDNEQNNLKKCMDGLVYGVGIMLGTSIPINVLNNISVVSTEQNIGFLDSIRYVYKGVEGAPPNSMQNFNRGLFVGHFPKEASRVGIKSGGLYTIKPWLEERYKPGTAQLAFAGIMSSFEMLINPVDKMRVDRQAGQAISLKPSKLYAGALGNGGRQFGTWYVHGQSNRFFNYMLANYTNIDPHSGLGTLLKAVPQSVCFTYVVFPIERLKNEMQFDGNKLDNAIKPKTAPEVIKNWAGFIKGNEPLHSSYIDAGKKIIEKEGLKGLYRGAVPKMWSNAILAAGATYLAELGNKARSR